jgi:DNA-binding MarR family transcriptional regulator
MSTAEQRAEADADELARRRLQTEAFLTFARVHRLIEQRVAALFVQEGLDVTPQQGNALMVLFQEKRSLTARALADLMSVSEVTVGRFVKALERDGWVKREAHPDDARARLLRPTRKAYRALPRFIRVSNALLDRAFATFSEPEVRRVVATGERVRENLREE